ncbi:hypothetical protein MR772_08975 [bacterium]|nr:hypothetical protein [bacterium]
MNQPTHAAMQVVGTQITDLTLHNDFLNLPTDCIRNINVDYHIDDIVSADNDKKESSSLLTVGHMTLTVENCAADGKKFSLRLSVDAGFLFSGTDTEAFSRLAKNNGAAILYSLTRGYVAGITSQCMNGSAISLPVLNFTNTAKE